MQIDQIEKYKRYEKNIDQIDSQELEHDQEFMVSGSAIKQIYYEMNGKSTLHVSPKLMLRNLQGTIQV